MKFLATAILLFLSSLSFADTRFDRIAALYSNGYAPAKSEVTGWWAGRCFQAAERDKPVGAALIASEIVTNDAGPEFPVESELFFGTVTDESSSAHFDQ